MFAQVWEWARRCALGGGQGGSLAARSSRSSRECRGAAPRLGTAERRAFTPMFPVPQESSQLRVARPLPVTRTGPLCPPQAGSLLGAPPSLPSLLGPATSGPVGRRLSDRGRNRGLPQPGSWVSMPLPSLNSLALWKLPENTLTQPMSGALPEGLASLSKDTERTGARACLEPQSGFLPSLDKLGGGWGARREKGSSALWRETGRADTVRSRAAPRAGCGPLLPLV